MAAAVLTLLVLFPGAAPAPAEAKLASPFTDHMVWQLDKKTPVRGTADSGENVTVEFAGQKKSVKAGAGGKWRISLDPLPASDESRTLTVTGSATKSAVKCADVIVGEVWLCSGNRKESPGNPETRRTIQSSEAKQATSNTE